MVCGLLNAGDVEAISAKSLPLSPTNRPATMTGGLDQGLGSRGVKSTCAGGLFLRIETGVLERLEGDGDVGPAPQRKDCRRVEADNGVARG